MADEAMKGKVLLMFQSNCSAMITYGYTLLMGDKINVILCLYYIWGTVREDKETIS